MQYENTVKGIFLERPNRFIARVKVEQKTETVHVKNTGRCKELLVPGASVILQKAENPNRKTKYDLISVYKPHLGWVNIDSQVPNKAVAEWLAQQDFTVIHPEYKYGNSRVDFYMERAGEKYLLEVKGCTLEIDGIGYFPDAPSLRAVKHCKELAEASGKGYHCAVAFVIAMNGVEKVLPNKIQDPAFAEALAYARKCGVSVLQLPCDVTEDSITIKERYYDG